MKILYFFSILMLTISANAQPGQESETQNKQLIKEYLFSQKSAWNMTEADIDNWIISDRYSNQKTGVTYLYVHQTVKGIRIFKAVSTVSVNKGEIKSFAKRIFTNAEGRINTNTPANSAMDAIDKALASAGVTKKGSIQFVSENKSLNRTFYDAPGISKEQIRVELVFQPVKNSLRLAWDVNFKPLTQDHWWNIRIDAVNGESLEKNDWGAHCDFESPMPLNNNSGSASILTATNNSQNSSSLLPAYRVYALPIEAPNSGASSLLSNPSDATASPFGWHDVNGVAGAEFTTTQGNNVHAYDDVANIDMPGHSADGTASLTFDFPVNFSQQPIVYQDASLTNLFYLNNTVHDILYHYGFDEPSGNFQQTNYSGSGAGSDYVLAECQDGGGTNNANFYTPEDGQNGVMQMYIWSGVIQSSLTVNSPAIIAGNYNSIPAAFGPSISVPVTGNLVLVDDGDGVGSDACQPLINNSAIAGKIAVIDRGTCDFVDKVFAAQSAGAIAVIMINNSAGGVIAMGDNGNGTIITIPSEMISLTDGNIIKSTMTSATVNATLNAVSTTANDIDGSLDNGVVIHEFGHGVSNRLTGGPSNSNCLFNGEQAGEGWSDFFGLMFTTRVGDLGTASRGIGTFATGQSSSGFGIRRFPYSTDMNINPHTYGTLAQSNEVHDIGEVWCAALWDLNWDMIDQFGFDPDWINGTSGNNITLSLVIEGLKLQPCGPGFLDGRDAILAADENLYGGIHKCLIWNSFARRGMGYNASQGDPETAGDETEDFSLPPLCLTPTSAPTANFSADNTTSCIGIVHFTDLSVDIPQSWTWDFGDGDTSNIQNPTHTYTSSGTFNVTLTVTNTIGADSLVRSGYISITFPPSPSISGNLVVGPGSTTTLTASLLTGNDAEWRDVGGNVIFTGNPFTTPSITIPTIYYVSQFSPTAISNVGPLNTSIGAGGYHNTSFEGKILFTTHAPMRLKSVFVDAATTTIRTINLYNGNNLINSMNVNIPAGQSRVQLNLDIPTPGNYQIGVEAGSNLFRNNAGASYPYSIAGIVDLTNSNSTTNPATFYYYLYNWEVQELPCYSQAVPVNIMIDGVGINDIDQNIVKIFAENNQLNLNFTTAPDNALLQVFDPIGKKIISSSLNNKNNFSFSLEKIASGFIVVMIDDGEKTYSKKIAITH